MTLFQGFIEMDVPVQGAVVRALVGGSGPPLLLLHGYPQTHAMWHPVVDDLAAHHTLVLPDLRGYGASRVLDGDLTFRIMARDQVTLMHHLGHERFHVVAHDRVRAWPTGWCSTIQGGCARWRSSTSCRPSRSGSAWMLRSR